MVLLDLSPAALHLLAAHSHHWLLGQLHPADEGLKALVGKRRFLPVQFDDSGEPKARVKLLLRPFILGSLITQKGAQGSRSAEGRSPHHLTVPPLSRKGGAGEAVSPFYREGK